MRSSRHQRRREPPRKHPAGSRKKKPPPERRRPRNTVSIEEAGPEFWEWVEEIEEMAAQSEEQHYWEKQREKLRRERDASNLKRKWL
jgi:hypothetical protein